MSDTKQTLKIYEQRIMNLNESDSPDELELDVSLVLFTRDTLANMTLTDSKQRTLDRLDVQLRAHAEVIVDFLPGPNPPGRDHWWWYLHERPQASRKAEKTAG